ncbi:CaiB/BaiF CoA transferase family protein [Actinacidiphila reveromycinica]|uniref:CaiB/BaiF CoA transferase family protein n=1 Tax=Actinacidiphila reveromycinica TaxID=659352 RepID=UPI00192276E6|nr:CoA transferase [Streptomyces sp. SN-593]
MTDLPTDAAAAPPLKQLRVIDASSLVAGPYCAKLFADFGAEVVKVEPPRGDEARRREPFLDDRPGPETSGTFLYLNLNKRGVTIDLERAEGRELFRRLLADADILIEDRSPAENERLGLDYASLREINPDLIVTSITPFGQTGPYRDYKAYPLNTFHSSGQGYLLPMNSADRSREPVKGASFIGECDAGLTAAIATLGALLWRDAGGSGQHIDVSKQHALMHLEKSQLRRYVDDGASPNRTGMGRLLETLVKGKDGQYVVIILSSEIQWRGLFEAMGRPTWGAEPPFNTQAGRSENYPELRERLQRWADDHTADEIFHMVQGQRSACAPVNPAESFVNSPQIEDRGFLHEVDHPVAGTLRYPGRPFQFSNVAWKPQRPAPLLGQHNAAVLGDELGLTPQELVKLTEAGVI